MRCSRLLGISLVVTVLGGSLAAAADAKTLVLRRGQKGPIAKAGEAGYVYYSVSPVGSEPPGQCRVEHEATFLSNEASKDKLAPAGVGAAPICTTGFRMTGELSAFELSGKGLLTLKAKPKVILHIPVTFELCELGGKCTLTTFECAYGLAKATGPFPIPGEIYEVVAGGVGKRSAKESDSRCPKTQEFQVLLTATSSRTGFHLWAEL